MKTYNVRLTVEGEQVDQTLLADDALHAIRQALAGWHRFTGEEVLIVSVRTGEAAELAAWQPRRSVA